MDLMKVDVFVQIDLGHEEVGEEREALWGQSDQQEVRPGFGKQKAQAGNKSNCI